MTPSAAAPTRRELGAVHLSGFRVLRSLARDDAAEVLLGHRIADPDGPQQVSPVAIKVSAATSDAWRAAMHECAAWERARGDHVVELLDVDADDESIRLVFERLPRGDLAELLRLRDRLDAGEAVTLLAPVANTLLRLHAAGVAHGNVSARTVLFRDDGSPVLIGFSGAELFESGAPEIELERVGGVLRDREAARALAVTVLGRVSGSRAHAARGVLADVEACDAELVLPLIASQLFEVAAAVPIRFQADEPGQDASRSLPRVVPVRAATTEVAVESRIAGEISAGTATRRVAALLRALVPEPLVQRVLDTAARSPASPVVAVSARAVAARWRSWSPRRRRVVLAIAAGALTVSVVTVVAPAPGTASPGAATVRPTAKSPVATASAAPTGPAAGSSRAVADDDPVAAAVALLRARDRCLGTLSVVCLDGVDEGGSGALEDDRAAIRTAQRGGELPVPGSISTDSAPPVLVERLGDSALVGLGTPSRGPASLLLVKGEAGWRIRDVIAAAQNSG